MKFRVKATNAWAASHRVVLSALAAAVLITVGGCRTSSPPARPGSTRERPSGSGTSNVPATAWQREIDRWIGTPYHRGGGDLNGADCSGFVQSVYRRVADLELPRITRDQFTVGFEVGRSNLRPGDLVFFETLGAGVSHVGLMVGGDRFAHASTSKGVRYSRLSETYWSTHYLGARRLP